MVFEGMTADDAKEVWVPFRQWVEQHPDTMSLNLDAFALPAEKMWDPRSWAAAVSSKRTTGPASREASSGGRETESRPPRPGDAYQSRWIPIERVQGAQALRLGQVLSDASRQWDVELHFNKGQAGASAEALQRDRDTSTPRSLSAAAPAIVPLTARASRVCMDASPTWRKGD